MPNRPEPESYASLAGDAYRSLTRAVEAVNHESLEFVRTIVGIFARPYESFAAKAIAKEQIARSAAAIAATIETLESSNAHAAEFARDVAEIVSSAHESYIDALRAIAETRRLERCVREERGDSERVAANCRYRA